MLSISAGQSARHGPLAKICQSQKRFALRIHWVGKMEKWLREKKLSTYGWQKALVVLSVAVESSRGAENRLASTVFLSFD